MTALILFDLDNTLISSYMEEPNKDYNTWHVLPGRAERLAQLRAASTLIGVVTNQAAVGYGFIEEDDARKKLQAVAAALGYGHVAIHSTSGFSRQWLTSNEEAAPGVLDVYVCYDKAGPRRKPNGGMIREAIDEALPLSWDEETETTGIEALYIGDRLEDEQAARDAGAAFQWAHAFFGEAR